jgi:hypothetical protein
MVPLNGLVAARGSVWIHLVIAGRVGEQVHLLLGDRHPVGGAQWLSHKVKQIRWVFQSCCHQRFRDRECQRWST